MVTANLIINKHVCICISMDNQILVGGNQTMIYQAYWYAPSNYIMGFTSSPLLLEYVL